MQRLTEVGELNNKQKFKMDQYNHDLAHQQAITREKRELVLRFAKDVQNIVQKQDDKAYITGIIKLN